jgi:hypothetical protein
MNANKFLFIAISGIVSISFFLYIFWGFDAMISYLSGEYILNLIG